MNNLIIHVFFFLSTGNLKKFRRFCPEETLILLSLVPVIFYKHLPNIRRILAGQEARVSWLWNAEREEARLQKRFSDQEWQKIYRKADHK